MELPNLNGVKLFALDTETKDDNLTTLGPGFITRDSYPIGISIATDTGVDAYYPIAHETGNVEFDIIGCITELVSRPDVEMVGANTRYDLEALWKIGIRPTCKISDIQVCEALLDENQQSFSLAKIAERRKVGKKRTSLIEEELVKQGYIHRGKPDWSKLYKLHPNIVGPYAVSDARLTLDIYLIQLKLLEEEGLRVVADLESELIPILFNMRLKGVAVDINKADEINSTLGIELEDKLLSIIHETEPVDPFSSNSLGKWVKTMGLVPPKTAKDNDSISNEWLSASNNPHLKAMADYRQGEKIRRDFIEGMLLNNSHRGLLHPQWFSTRGSSFMSGDDSNGTRSGRIACTDPNLTQIPRRNPTYGPLVRQCFISRKGGWIKADYETQEPRITVHYAALMGLPGAAEMQQGYIDNPRFDLHQAVTDMINEVREEAIERGTGKTINLSLVYGMGLKKLAARLGISVQQCKTLLEAYHGAVPFVKLILAKCGEIAADRGYVRTILGRRRRFVEWENASYGAAWSPPEKNKTLALAKWGKIRRANTYKALNSIVQGSAAEQTKKSIVALYKAGLMPLMQIYDELNFESDDADRDVPIVKDLMENTLPFNVPTLVDIKVGTHWGNCK
jgi:DNA polymerase I-like protein with 3'-5' exonuclease and polymerase domains